MMLFLDAPLSMLLVALAVLVGLFFVLRGLVLPKSFVDNETKRERMRKARLEKEAATRDEGDRETGQVSVGE